MTNATSTPSDNRPDGPSAPTDYLTSQGQQSGVFLSFSDFPSEYVSPRNITVWLPPDYMREPGQRYRVIYAHDGQNLFDPKTSYIGVDWGLHEALGRLQAEGLDCRTLVVGIWNTPKRYQEYDPRKVFEEYLTRPEQIKYAWKHGRPLGDSYLKFIVRELKPFIDKRFRTHFTKNATFLLGSSMGGIISAAALCEYPEVFGAAACLSTHWPTGKGKMAEYLNDRLPDPHNHRFYFDYGTETTDAQYEPFQHQVDEVMRRKGYIEGTNWVTQKFPGDDHSERAWRRRIDIPLRFLLK